MSKERVKTLRNTGTSTTTVWDTYYIKTVADAVLMSDDDAETKNIKQYTDEKVAALVNGAPETLDTLKEVADAIASNKTVVDGLNAAIGDKAAKVHTHTATQVTGLATVATSGAYSSLSGIPVAATATVDGLMAKADKAKLDGVAASANNYVHPATHPASIIVQDATNRFMTDAERTKLTGIAAGAEVNQNAFSSVKVGAITVAADTKTDTVELIAGTGVTIAADAATDKITFSVTGESVAVADVATKLATPRAIGISGAVTGAGVAFDGSADITIATTAVNATKLTGLVPVASLPAATTAAKGAVQLTSGVASASETTAATANAVKTAHDKAVAASTAATAAQTAANSKATIYIQNAMPATAPVGAICFLIG